MSKKKMDGMYNLEEEQFPTNSKASREIPTRPEVNEDPPVTVLETPPGRLDNKATPRAIRRRKSITRSIKQTLFSEDTKNVVEHVIFEVLVPAAKTMISDMFSQAIEMMLFGESSGRKRSRDRGERTMVSYGSMYKREDERERRPTSRRDRFGLSDIYFTGPKAGEQATDVLSDMCDLLEKYEQVSVADYFDLANLDGATHAHVKWGWTSLKKAYCTFTRNGYVIILPEPEELD